jgi:phospholipase/carboxylesterase
MPEVSEQRIIQEFPCYYDLYEPEGAKPKPLLIALHGYGGDKSSMMRLARRINEQDYIIAALQGPHQHIVRPKTREEKLGYGFGWLTNFKPEESVALHHRNVRQIITTLTANGSADARNVFLLGFSQAVGVNFRFAFTHGTLVRGVIAICGGIPSDWETTGKYEGNQIEVLYIGAERDEFYAPEQITRFSQALQRRARSVELQMFDTGHEVPRDAYPLIDQWIQSKVRTT